MVVSSQHNYKGEVDMFEKILQKTTAMALSALVRGMHREFCESSSSTIPLTRRLVKHTKLQIRTFDNLQDSCVAVRPCITILTRTKTKPVLFSFFVCTIRIGLRPFLTVDKTESKL